MARKTSLRSVAVTLACIFLTATAGARVDPALPAYRPAQGVEISGMFVSVGSDTMVNLMTLWAEGFARYHPDVHLEVEGKGSSSAPPALIAGTAQFGPMSRKMKATEVDAFEARYGYPPTVFGVALDALVVYVHKDNPIEGLTLAQVDALFSRTRWCGYPEPVATWSDLGLGGRWANRPVSLYGRNAASGTYGFFKENALCGGDYKDTVKEQPGSAAVVQGISVDPDGIGYSGIGYRTSGVRVVPLARAAGEPFVEPTLENVASGAYPLGRFLWLYVNKAPGEPLPPMVAAFIRFIYSREGQAIVLKDGYLPLPASVTAEALARLAEMGAAS